MKRKYLCVVKVNDDQIVQKVDITYKAPEQVEEMKSKWGEAIEDKPGLFIIEAIKDEQK